MWASRAVFQGRHHLARAIEELRVPDSTPLSSFQQSFQGFGSLLNLNSQGNGVFFSRFQAVLWSEKASAEAPGSMIFLPTPSAQLTMS